MKYVNANDNEMTGLLPHNAILTEGFYFLSIIRNLFKGTLPERGEHASILE